MGGIAGGGGQGRLGEGFAGAKHMDNLLLPRGADAVHIDRPALHEIKTARGFAFAKEIIVPGQRKNDGEGSENREIVGR